jgi:hypothetical protein
VPRSRSVPLALASVLMLAVLAAPVPAGANVITRTDRNDTAGPLDLASVRVTHATGASVFRITTRQHFRNSQIARDRGLFEVDLDTNADRKANFYAIVFFRHGGMRSWLFKGNGDRIAGTLSASRASRRAVQVTVPLAKIGNPKSYDFAAFSAFFATPCRSKAPCIDSIPNRFPLIRHDLTGPRFTWNPIPPTYSTDITAHLAFPVGFTVKDDRYGSGVKNWTLQRKEVGTTTWVTVKVGTKLAATLKVTGVEQGKSYDLRVIVRDHQGNKTISSVERTSVPYDDTNVFFTYSTSPAWTAHTSITDQFRLTTHTGGTDASVSFDVPQDSIFCVLGGMSSTPTADASIVNAVGDILHETSLTLPRTQFCFQALGSIEDLVTVTITVTGGDFVLDGVAILR